MKCQLGSSELHSDNLYFWVIDEAPQNVTNKIEKHIFSGKFLRNNRIGNFHNIEETITGKQNQGNLISEMYFFIFNQFVS